MRRQLVWFKRDLRIFDHEALSRAGERGPVLPLYIVEPDLWKQPDASGRQWLCIRESLLELREALSELGQPLIFRQGDAVGILRELHTAHDVAAVWSHQETGNGRTFLRDQKVAALLDTLQRPWHQSRQHGVVHGSFQRDRWSKQWEQLMRTAVYPPPRALTETADVAPGVLPEWPTTRLEYDDCPGCQRGGRKTAEQRLQSFLLERGQRYHRELSIPASAAQSCSRISPHLAAGTLSVREVLQATPLRRASVDARATADERGWRRALSAFEGRLHWHCHFISMMAHSKPYLPSRVCATCDQPFTWRKRWRNNWPEIRYCSERCRRNKRSTR